jgi:diguanylate cyclase (GGDEF)-like protein
MGKLGDSRRNADTLSGERLLNSGDQHIMELMDDLYQLEQFRRGQLTLRKLARYLKSSATRREVYAAIQCFGPQLWPEATGVIYLLGASGEYLERAVSWGDASLNEPTIGLQDCWAMRCAQTHYVPDMSVEVACRHVLQAESAPTLCVPLLAQGNLLGLLHLRSVGKTLASAPRTVSRESPTFLGEAVGEDLSLALSNIALRDSLREQSIRDALTGLFNRRFFEEFLMRELARAGRKTRQVSMVLLDIDHFKKINDTFGHGAGDMVLRRMGPVLQSHVRESDIACRIGGEEFLLLLAELSLPTAVQRAERIRKAIRELALSYEDKPLGPITASFGAAAYPDHGSNVEALFRAADEALYQAKRTGRDKVVSARLPA